MKLPIKLIDKIIHMTYLFLHNFETVKRMIELSAINELAFSYL